MTGLLMKTIPGLKLKLILPDNATLLGRGKIELLKAIAKEHSLSQAAKIFRHVLSPSLAFNSRT